MGIDPGLAGGVAILYDSRVGAQSGQRPDFDWGAWPMPVRRFQYGTDRRRRGKVQSHIDVVTLHWMATMHRADTIVVEQQTARPGQGAPGLVTSFANYGLVLSLRLIAPVHVVHPATWKARLKVPADKDKATKRCAELFPGQQTPDHDGPAEALMLALYWSGMVRENGPDQAELWRAGAVGKAKAVRGGFPAGATGARGADGAVADARPGRLGAARGAGRVP